MGKRTVGRDGATRARLASAALLMSPGLFIACGETPVESSIESTGGSTETQPALPEPAAIDPPLGDPLGGVRVLITGAHLTGAAVAIGGSPCGDIDHLDDGALRCRAPSYLPLPFDWEETYAPIGTVVGGVDNVYPNSSIGLSGGAVVMVNREEGSGPAGEPLWARAFGGAGLQEGPGEVRLAGLSHAPGGEVTVWVDGLGAAASGTASYETPRAWSRVGGSLDGDGYYGPHTRFAGTLGAVLILPQAIDADLAARIHTWARGRFGAR